MMRTTLEVTEESQQFLRNAGKNNPGVDMLFRIWGQFTALFLAESGGYGRRSPLRSLYEDVYAVDSPINELLGFTAAESRQLLSAHQNAARMTTRMETASSDGLRMELEYWPVGQRAKRCWHVTIGLDGSGQTRVIGCGD